MLYVAALAVYSIVWMDTIRRQDAVASPRADLIYEPSRASARVFRVEDRGPAARAGLRPGDRVTAIDGVGLTDLTPILRAYAGHQPGERIEFTISREGRQETLPIVVEPAAGGLLGREAWSAERGAPGTLGQRAFGLVLTALNFYPLLFLAVGAFVLLQRPEDRNAWIMALTFGGFIAGAPLLQIEPILPRALRGFMLGLASALTILLPASLYFFFAVFPASSRIDRAIPWAKYLLLGGAAVAGIPLAVACVAWNSSYPLWWLFERLTPSVLEAWYLTYTLVGMGLALLSLLANAFGQPDIRRKTAVVLAGTLASIVPISVINIIAAQSDGPPEDAIPVWAWALAVLALGLLPISIAYAVVKHRVMELPVLLRRSARYVLVRRGAVTLAVLLGLSAAVAFASLFSRYFGHDRPAAQSSGLIAGSLFGGLLALAGQRLWRPAEERIDRAFFRKAYDARRILERVGIESRVATDRHALASLLERALEDALQPRALYVYLRQGGPPVRLVAAGDDAEALAAMPLALDTPAARELERRAQPVVLDADDLAAGQPFAEYAALGPELVVPMLGRGGQLEGLLLLGPRLSEEPYSGEDRALLASAAAQAGLALENIRLAERMALQLEAERRQARDLEIAKAVQAKLLPQHTPTLATLQYAGVCVQAREVGGDYYDFMAAGPGRLALVMADISGKGMSAALLMASLQASLRAQYMLAPGDLRGVLRSVNRIFYESTATNHYATLFFAVYDGVSRRLEYANCGHLPPMVLRRAGNVERLSTTAPVVGLFEPWDCETAETRLDPGDLLLVFTDGATEATSPSGEEFGEARLLELLCQYRDAPPADLLSGILSAVTGHGGPLQYDDLTLIAARAS